MTEKKQNSSFLQDVFNDLFIKICRTFNSRKVTVEDATMEQKVNYYRYEQVSQDGMSLLTENFLRGNLFFDLLKKDPPHILNAILDFYHVSKDPIYPMIAADVCRFYAREMKGEERVKAYLSSLYFCFLSIQTKKVQSNKELNIADSSYFLQELQLYNEAVAGVFIYLKENNLIYSTGFEIRGFNGMYFRFENPVFRLSVPRNSVSDYSLCSAYNVKSLRMVNRHPGFGVPLVAKISDPKLSESLRTPPGLTIPVTIAIQLKKTDDNEMTFCPVYQDTSVSESLPSIEGAIYRNGWYLSRDFTTPLACFMNDLTQRNLLAGMLSPVKYDPMAGLYMIEPYHPGRIPVVFIHGLMSSPETWGQMINSLKYNTKIREKYQFWFYSYSTGAAVIYSAKKLHDALLAAQKEFCTTPESTRNFEQMVIVGHSMGGLVARILMQEHPEQIIECFAKKPWPEVRKKLGEEDLELVENFCIIRSLPFVKRMIFMAVPHRGAPMAKRGLAKLGINLIRMPSTILTRANDFERIMKHIFPDANFKWRKNSFITGIDNLKPDSHFVRWLSGSPVKKGIPFHSIIGNQRSETEAGGSDGIVKYSSSHLEGAVSERIVKSTHNVHCTPSAILEVMRILLLHLDDKEK